MAQSYVMNLDRQDLEHAELPQKDARFMRKTTRENATLILSSNNDVS